MSIESVRMDRVKQRASEDVAGEFITIATMYGVMGKVVEVIEVVKVV